MLLPEEGAPQRDALQGPCVLVVVRMEGQQASETVCMNVCGVERGRALALKSSFLLTAGNLRTPKGSCGWPKHFECDRILAQRVPLGSLGEKAHLENTNRLKEKLAPEESSLAQNSGWK